MLLTVLRWLRPLGRSLVKAGALYVDSNAAAIQEAARGLPPGHPERLCPDLPLSPLELSLSREMASSTRFWPRRAD